MGREIENQTRHLHVTATNALCFYLFWQTIQHLLAGMFFTITHIIKTVTVMFNRQTLKKFICMLFNIAFKDFNNQSLKVSN